MAKCIVILVIRGNDRDRDGDEQEHGQHSRKDTQEVRHQRGDEVVFLGADQGLVLLRVPPLNERFGSGRAHRDELIRAVRELEAEHHREAAG